MERTNWSGGIGAYSTASCSREEETALTTGFARFLTKQRIQVTFVAVGIWNTIFGYAVFLGLDTLGSAVFQKRYVAYMTAMVLSNVIAIINAFVLHKYVTFRSAIRGRKMIIEFLKFCTTYLVTFFLSIILLPLLVELGNAPPKIAAGVVIIICTLISYLGHSRFSFRPLPRRGQREKI